MSTGVQSVAQGMATPIIGVFEGGGVKGLALAGAAAATMDAGYEFCRVVGTSAGAIVGGLVMAGYKSDELADAICSSDWPAILDPFPISRVPGIGKHLSVFFKQGLYKGDRLEAMMAELLGAKGVETFDDLHGVLRIVVTDLTHTRGLVLPDALGRLGLEARSFPLARAIRMSASVPFAFAPVEVSHPETGDVAVISDGAMAANFPIRVVDPDAGLPAIGFRFVDEPGTHPHRAIEGPLSFAAAVIASGMAAREGLPSLRSSLVDLVSVPSSRAGLDFDITPSEARDLFEEGYRAVAARLRDRPLSLVPGVEA